jgi:hypothetical protein
MRSILKNSKFIHFLVVVGFLALWGYISTSNPYLLLGITASFSGAVCGSFILVVDTIKDKR